MIVFLENFGEKTTVQPMLSFKKIFTKILWFNPYSLYGKFSSKEYQNEPILFFLKYLNRQYGSTDIVFLQNIDQKII